MHFTQSLHVLAVIGSTLVAAAPPAHHGDLDRRDDYDDLIEPCKGMPDKEEEGLIYRLGLKFTQSGGIDGGGDPTISGSGGVITYDNDCNIIDEKEWNGGAGYMKDWLKVEKDEPDLKLNLKMGNPLLNTNKESRIPTPSEAKYKNDDGDLSHRDPDVECQDGWSKNDFPAVKYYRMCYVSKGV